MRIAITSRERLFVDGLASMFDGTNYQAVISCVDGRECVLAARNGRADLIIYDIREAPEDELQFVLGAQIFGNFKLLAIAHKSDEAPKGFDAVMSDSGTSEELKIKVRELAAGIVRMQPRGRGRPRVVTNGLELSEREYEVAMLIAKGHTNHRISEIMALKEQSVKNLVSTVIRKLNCENRVQVALRLRDSG